MNRYRTRYWSILQYSSSTSLFLIYSISISIMLFSSISTLFLNFCLYFNVNLPSELSIKTGRVNGILFSMWNAVKPSVTWPWQAGRCGGAALVRRPAVTGSPAGFPGLSTAGESKRPAGSPSIGPFCTDSRQDR